MLKMSSAIIITISVSVFLHRIQITTNFKLEKIQSNNENLWEYSLNWLRDLDVGLYVMLFDVIGFINWLNMS